jgi:ribosomal protein L28
VKKKRIMVDGQIVSVRLSARALRTLAKKGEL